MSSGKPPAIDETDPRSRSVIAAEKIREMVLEHSVAPGARLDERSLVEALDLSRTPIRESLRRLEYELLIKLDKNKGAVTRSIDLKHIRIFFDAYFACEEIVGHYCNLNQESLSGDLSKVLSSYSGHLSDQNFRAVTRAYQEFHLRISTATENEFIIAFSDLIYMHGRRLSNFVYQMESNDPNLTQKMEKIVMDERAELITAIETNDRAKFRRLLRQHAELFHSRIQRFTQPDRGLEFKIES